MNKEFSIQHLLSRVTAHSAEVHLLPPQFPRQLRPGVTVRYLYRYVNHDDVYDTLSSSHISATYTRKPWWWCIWYFVTITNIIVSILGPFFTAKASFWTLLKIELGPFLVLILKTLHLGEM